MLVGLFFCFCRFLFVYNFIGLFWEKHLVLFSSRKYSLIKYLGNKFSEIASWYLRKYRGETHALASRSLSRGSNVNKIKKFLPKSFDQARNPFDQARKNILEKGSLCEAILALASIRKRVLKSGPTTQKEDSRRDKFNSKKCSFYNKRTFEHW